MLKRLSIVLALALFSVVLVRIIPGGGPAPKRHLPLDMENLERESQDLEGDINAATRYFLDMRLPQGATALDPSWYRSAIDAANRMEVFSSSIGATSSRIGAAGGAALGTWSELGPSNIGGRTRALLIHPSNPSIMYAAGVAGGVWKSTNAGASWTQLTDLGLPNLAVTNLVFDPANPNVIYAATGEGFFNADAVRGAGIFRSTDAGTTWAQLPSTATSDFYYVNRLVTSPNTGMRLYAATRTGVFRSLDAGGSWTKVIDGRAVNGCMDVRVQPNRALAFVFAACGSFATDGIYRALDNNNTQTWTKVFTAVNMGRTSLAIAPSNPSVIYAMSASTGGANANGLLGVYRSTSNGGSGTWTTQLDASVLPAETTAAYQNVLLLTNPVYAYTACVGSGKSFNNQGWYDNILAVDPANPNVVFAGGIDLFRSDDGGANWGIMSYWWYPSGDAHYAHADNHVFAFQPGYNGVANQTLYVGSDGGLFRTDNARAATVSGFPDGDTTPAACSNATAAVTWTNLNNGYDVTQFEHGLPYPNGGTYFGGTQDNGTIRGSALPWTTIAGGDGGWVAVDPTNTNTIFHEYTGLSLQRSTNGGSSWSYVTTGISGDTFPFYTFYRMDPSNPQNLWIAGQRMWRTTNQATSWTQASTAMTSGSVSSIAISPASSNVVLAGTASGRVANSTAALSGTSATAWPFVYAWGNGCGRVSWLEFQPGSTTVAYATSSTFGAKTGDASGCASGTVSHVRKTTDGGNTWTSIDGSGANTIPDVPVFCVAVSPTDNNRLYVGTDIGVFTSVDGGLNWYKENTGFANVPVYNLAFDNTGRLYAFTHGRGAWRVTPNP
ncbi:MAG: hypothetical protein JST11_05440 [Acidobacteria bacterium]|nr:hypothetical protein [Acidobacteriota bacterium]